MRDTAMSYLALHLAAEKKGQEAQAEEFARQSVDAYRAILNSSLPEIEKGPDRVAQEVLTLLVGGSATTMRVMSRIVYHVNANHDVLKRLREVVDAVIPTPSVHPDLEVLEQQEYLVSISTPASLPSGSKMGHAARH